MQLPFTRNSIYLVHEVSLNFKDDRQDIHKKTVGAGQGCLALDYSQRRA
jgi:hypothetical protein